MIMEVSRIVKTLPASGLETPSECQMPGVKLATSDTAMAHPTLTTDSP
jgi:hypothetical protein